MPPDPLGLQNPQQQAGVSGSPETASTTPSGQPIVSEALPKTNVPLPDDGPKPTGPRPLGSQEELQKADPQAANKISELAGTTDNNLPRTGSPDNPQPQRVEEFVAPLRPGDVIQGPNDRRNRRPTEAELSAGKDQFQYDLSPDEVQDLENTRPEVIDPPIDENAPKDVPADPRKVAESRGIKIPEKQNVE